MTEVSESTHSADAMSGQKSIVITGGNSGIGFGTARALAADGWRVVLTGRDRTGLEQARRLIDPNGEGLASYHIGDFASLASVRTLAEALAGEERIDVLLNNVGILLSSRRVTDDGHDMLLQVNHLAPFLLTNLLLDKLKADGPARIVNVGSNVHKRTTGYGFDDFHFERRFRLQEAYGRTKLYTVMFTRELAHRLEGTGVTANALHPGVIRTRIGRDGDAGGPFGLIWPLFQRLGMDDPKLGSKVTRFVAAAPELDGVTGEYFSTDLKPEQPNPLALDDAACRRLWEMSAKLVGLG